MRVCDSIATDTYRIYNDKTTTRHDKKYLILKRKRFHGSSVIVFLDRSTKQHMPREHLSHCTSIKMQPLLCHEWLVKWTTGVGWEKTHNMQGQELCMLSFNHFHNNEFLTIAWSRHCCFSSSVTKTPGRRKLPFCLAASTSSLLASLRRPRPMR